MGIFSKLFGSSSDIKKQLEAQYLPMIQMMMGMSASEAKNKFLDMIKKAKEDAIKEGTINLPHNFGDILLEKESTDEKIKSMLAKRRKEGVKDDDIRWWWNMHELERKMMLIVDQWSGLAYFMKLKEDGLNEEEVAKNFRKTHPIFGDPDDTTRTTGEDRPLLQELKDRINIYIEKLAQTDPETFKKELDKSTSFNAFIRKKIKEGNI